MRRSDREITDEKSIEGWMSQSAAGSSAECLVRSIGRWEEISYDTGYLSEQIG